MFSLTHSNSDYGFNPSQFRVLADCPNFCPVNQCLVDCVCKPQDECHKKDFTVILIVVTVAAIVIILLWIGCYLFRKEKSRDRSANFNVADRAQISRRDIDNSEAHLQIDPLDMPVLGHATDTNAPVNKDPHPVPTHFPFGMPSNVTTTGPVQMVITVNAPHIIKPQVEDNNVYYSNGKSQTEPVEDNSISFINNRQQTDIAIEDPSFINNKTQVRIATEGRENQNSPDKSVLKDLVHTKEEHNNSNLIIHKTPINQLDNFEISESKEEKSYINKSRLDMSESKDEKDTNPFSKLDQLDISEIKEEKEVDRSTEKEHL